MTKPDDDRFVEQSRQALRHSENELDADMQSLKQALHDRFHLDAEFAEQFRHVAQLHNNADGTGDRARIGHDLL